MSTVHEVITARHCEITVFAFSLITNLCVIDYDDPTEANHEEVVEIARKRRDILMEFVTRMVSRINETMNRKNV